MASCCHKSTVDNITGPRAAKIHYICGSFEKSKICRTDRLSLCPRVGNLDAFKLLNVSCWQRQPQYYCDVTDLSQH
jgi:hypothetical protein